MSDVEEKIREAVLEKARREAEKIVAEARKEAERIIEKARREWEENRNRIREQILEDAKRRAEEIIIDARIRARMKLTEAKREVVEEVLRNIVNIIRKDRFDRRESVYRLLREAIGQLEGDIRVYVAEKDLEITRGVVRELSRGNKVKIMEIKTANIMGGVIAESIDGTVRIDNSYEARLELVRTRLVPEIQRELFGEQKP